MDIKVIETRLQKLDSFVRNLHQLETIPLDEYLADENVQAVVERRLQLAIQSCMDIAGYVVASLALQSPDEPENIFVLLGKEGILSHDLSRRMAGMVRFRNILVHDYLEIDSEIVHAALAGEVADFKQFAADIMTWLSSRPYDVANP